MMTLLFFNFTPMSFYKKGLSLALGLSLLASGVPARASVNEYLSAVDEFHINHLDNNMVYDDVTFPSAKPVRADFASDADFHRAMDQYHRDFAVYFMSYNVAYIPWWGSDASEGATGLIGYESTSGHRSFRPGNNINRAELAKMVMWSTSLAKSSNHDYNEPAFPDIERGEWYDQITRTLAKNNIVQGVPQADGTRLYMGASNATWSEFFKYAVNAFELHDGNQINEASADIWYKPYQDILYSKGILSAEMQVDPGALVTRSDVLLVCFRAFIAQSVKDIYGEPVNFSDDLVRLVVENTHSKMLNAAADAAYPERDALDSSFYMYDLLFEGGSSARLYAIEDSNPSYDGSAADETVYVQNTGTESMDLGGYTLSVLQTQTGWDYRTLELRYTFPEGTVLEPEQVASVTGDVFMAQAMESDFYRDDAYFDDELFVGETYGAVLLYNDSATLVDIAVAGFAFD